MNCQIKYLQTAGNPSARRPDFLQERCLVKTTSGEIECDLGPDSNIGNVEAMLKMPLGNLSECLQNAKIAPKRKRRIEATPQKGCRRKRMTTSTPKKDLTPSLPRMFKNGHCCC